ncbi:MAG TPA: TonB family protein [Caulobacteraceae bacterium]
MTGLAFAILLAASAASDPAPPPVVAPMQNTPVHAPRVVTNPRFIRVPNAQDFAALYPPKALEDGIEGKTTMACDVVASGELTNCKVTSETPAGAGFGAAALRTAPLFRLAPKTDEGASVAGAHIAIPLTWRLAPVVAPSSLPPASPPLPTLPPVVSRSSIPIYGNPVWARAPTRADLDFAAIGQPDTPGSAVMECLVMDTGALLGCSLTGAYQGNGFGYALLKLASKYQVDLSPAGSPDAAGKRVVVAAAWGVRGSPNSLSMSSDAGIAPAASASQRDPSAPPAAVPTLSGDVIENPVWARTPTKLDFDVAMGVAPEGIVSAVMECTILRTGDLTACKTVHETYQTTAAGDALFKLRSKYRVDLSRSGGDAVVGKKVHISLVWGLKGSVPTTTPPWPDP